jgi:hypothetical protein
MEKDCRQSDANQMLIAINHALLANGTQLTRACAFSPSATRGLCRIGQGSDRIRLAGRGGTGRYCLIAALLKYRTGVRAFHREAVNFKVYRPLVQDEF